MFYLFKNTWKYAGEDRYKLIICYVLHTISISGELLQPFAFGMAVNALQLNGIENLRPIIFWFGIYLAGFFIFQIFHHSGRYFEITTALKNQQRIVDTVYAKLCRLPMRWHADHHSGETVNRIKVAGEALKNFSFSQSDYLENTFLGIVPIIVLAKVNYKITFISLILITINMIIVFRMNRVIQSILNKINESSHAFSGRIADFVSNIKTVITLRLKEQTKKEINNKFDVYYKEQMREFRINQPRCFLIAFGAIITELIVIFFYIWSNRVSDNVFMIGNLVMLITYFKQMRDAIFELASSFYDTMHWKASIKSVDIILNGPYKHEVENSAIEVKSWHHMIIKDLEFRYGNDEFKFQNMNLELSNRSKIAIVGSSGSGKSTLLHLLAGLYEPDRVKLTIDDKEYGNFKRIADSIALISQDSEIFENTILNNITFGLEPDLVELEKAIKAARFGEVIECLPKGINTDIREKGVNLSGGQKQRLALARGLYFSRTKNILLLDEITRCHQRKIDYAADTS